MQKISNKLSLLIFIIICGFLFTYRISHVSPKEISWDVLGYYMYLPSTFIYDQPLLNDYTWLKEINAQKDLTGTLYQVSSNDQGEPMYFFLMGMSLFYLPFFLIAHLTAGLLNFPMEGFSAPYQYSLVVGGIIYTIIGLFFLRKILRRFFDEVITALVMITIVFGTNYIHHLTHDNLGTVNVLFMLLSIIIWHTMQWNETFKNKHLVIIGIGIILMALVKPSEILVVILFIFWGVTSRESLKQKLIILYRKKTILLLIAGLCLVLALPQMIYWYLKTGYPIYDSYKNPGVGLDLFSPHIIKALFSYRKGWLLYTPVMVFSLIGFYYLFRDNKRIFLAFFGYWIVAFYIVVSWSEWWYGAAYSNRALITTYPVLAVSLGYLLQEIRQKKLIIRIFLSLFILLFIFLNQFQWWQLKNYILDPYRTTKAFYWATFLKTSVSEEDKKLLMVERDSRGIFNFTDSENYDQKLLFLETFDGKQDIHSRTEIDGNSYYQLLPNQEYSITYSCKFNELTKKDHVWIRAMVDIRYPQDFDGSFPCLVLTMEYKGRSYGYFAPELKVDSLNTSWKRYQFDYLTPEIRTKKDIFKCYVWKRGNKSFDIDNLKLELFEKK
jgi:hypothetical protein